MCEYNCRKFTTLVSIVLFTAFLSGCQSIAGKSKGSYARNPALVTLKPDYPGNPTLNGKFVGPYRSVTSGSRSLWKYASSKFKSKKFESKQTQAPNIEYPPVVVMPYQPKLHTEPHLAWLGHATMVIELCGLTVVVDPILNSPKLFHGKRLIDVPIAANQLEVDILLASHAHRDHLDKSTVKALGGNNMKAYVPLNMGNMLTQWRPDILVQEAGWYQVFNTGESLSVTLFPALHWSRRSLLDTNDVLWGSYLLECEGTSVFIAGDTGYGDHFAEIRKLVDHIDYAVLPIGAYEPVELVGNSHMNPEQAVQAFKDLGAETMIPTHYGTYDLSDEPVGEPLHRFLQHVKKQKLDPTAVKVLAVGEVLLLK